LKSRDLEDRKDHITGLRQKFYDELLTNADTYEKMKNTPLMFNSSTFVLLHKVSSKYVSLNDSDSDNLL